MKNHNDRHECEEEPAKEGEENPKFMKKYNLSENSHPADWFKNFLVNKLTRACEYGTYL